MAAAGTSGGPSGKGAPASSLFPAAGNVSAGKSQKGGTSVAAGASGQPVPGASLTTPPAGTSFQTSQPPFDFVAHLKTAVADGCVSDSFSDEIKKRFAAPIAHAAAAPVGGNQTLPTASSGFGARASAPLLGSVGAPAGMWFSSLPGPSALQNSAAMESKQLDTAVHNVQVTKELLALLLQCDSGSCYRADQESTKTERKEGIAGLHAAVGKIANSTASNLLQYLRKELTSSTSLYRGATTTLGRSFTDSSMVGSAAALCHSKAHSNPILLSAQCLYLLTRHFQMQEAVVKELGGLVEQLCDTIQLDVATRDAHLRTFNSAPETEGLCSLTWLVIFSMVNSLAVWKQMRNESGALVANSLLQTNVASVVDTCIQAIHNKMDLAGSADGGSGYHSTYHATTHTRSQLSRLPVSARGPVSGGHTVTVHRSVAVVEGYLSVLVLAAGCFLRTKGDDKGYDKALEAFLGTRVGGASVLTRGKVTKRMIQLAPVATTLYIPMEYIYIVPYEILSYLFDHMLPLLRHLADLEIASYCKYVDQMQLLEDAPRGQERTASAYPVDSHGVLGFGVKAVPQVHARGLEPFTSEMSHLLHTLAVCLEHLPTEVLNPDFDIDCAATFFIFRNCVRHIVQVFKVQRGTSTLWETFTLKVVSHYLHVLTMIGRNPQYIERVIAMFSGAQTDCQEMQWPSLVNQALECCGFSTNGSGAIRNVISLGGLSDPEEAPTSTRTDGASVYPHFTVSFLRKCQRRYIVHFFMLLRQSVAHSVLRVTVTQYLTLEVALSFLFASHLSQSMLGSTLSLISSMITKSSEAALVWQFLDTHMLLQPQQSRTSSNTTSDGVSSVRINGVMDSQSCDTNLSLLGHCRYECTQGYFDITIGFLNLMNALFRHDVPGMTSFSAYTSVVHFVAQEIFRGVLRRSIAVEKDRYTVMALAAAVLTQAFAVHFCAEGTTTVIPFATILAVDRAPNDVLGEALQMIALASDTAFELMSHQRAAVRQCVRLIIAAIAAHAEQKLEIYSFESRVTQNSSLVIHILSLCSLGDTMLTTEALQLMLLFPSAVVNQASRYWYSESHRFEQILSVFVHLLRPESSAPSIIHAAPELAVLDADGDAQSEKTQEAWTVETKSLLLDLLILHASTTQPSLTWWFCGFPNASASTSDTVRDTALFNSLVEGSTSEALDQVCPNLAVKYIKLLYLLRSNPHVGSTVVRQLMETCCQTLFLAAQKYRPDKLNPLLLSKYAYVLKLLALEACYAYRHTPEQLHVDYAGMPSISIEVLLSFVNPHRYHTGEALPSGEDDKQAVATNRSTEGCDAPADITQWLAQMLRSLPAFPDRRPTSASDVYIVQATDGAAQFNIRMLYDSLQQEQQRLQLPPLSINELHDKLRPYVEANECFIIYAAAANFVDGWSQLIDTATCLVQGISQTRMQLLAQSIIEGMDATTSLTVAAQEQIVYRLFGSLATVLAQLQRRVEQRMRSDATGGDNLLSSHNQLASRHSSDGKARPFQKAVAISEQSVNRRHQRDGLHQSQFTGRPSAVREERRSYRGHLDSSVFSTQAGNRSNMLSPFTRSELARTFVGRQGDVKASEAFSYGAATQALLRPLIGASVQWGTRFRSVRGDIYDSIMCLTAIPGIEVDDVMVYRSQFALFGMLVEDICASAEMMKSTRQSALTLLVHLLQVSPALCDVFCHPTECTADGLGPFPVRCAAALFKHIDDAIMSFITRGGSDMGSIFWLIRGTFDVLCIISQRNTAQLVQGNVITMCMSMECWLHCPQIVLGHTSDQTEGMNPMATQEQNKLLLMRLMLGCTRWLNVMLAMLGDSTELVNLVNEFVVNRRQLMEFLLEFPLLSGKANSISTTNLTLYVEMTELLCGLATSSCAEECRRLTHEMALPDLLLTLCHIEPTEGSVITADGWKGCTSQLDTWQEMGRVGVSATWAQHGGQDGDVQQNLVALTVRNIAHFLLRSEYGNRTSSPALAVGTSADDAAYPMLRSSARSVSVVLQIVSHFLQSVERRCANARGWGASELRLECYMHALHAFVCLLHSFVIPLPAASASSSQPFSQYLRSLPLGQILYLLQSSQTVVVDVYETYTAGRTGAEERRMGDAMSVTAQTIGNKVADTCRGLAAVQRSPIKEKGKPQATPTVGFARSQQDMPPSTPRLHPAESNLFLGNKSNDAEGDEKSSPYPERSFTNRLSTVSGGYAGHGNLPTGAASGMLGWSHIQAKNGGNSIQMPVETSNALSVKDTTIGALLPSDYLTAVEFSGVADPDDTTYLPALSDWECVLTMDRQIRQLKIAMANAIRAVGRAQRIVDSL